MGRYYKRRGGFPWVLVVGGVAAAVLLFKWEWVKSLLKKKIA